MLFTARIAGLAYQASIKPSNFSPLSFDYDFFELKVLNHVYLFGF